MATNPHSQSTSESLPRIRSLKKIVRPPSREPLPTGPSEQPAMSVASLKRPRSQSDIHSARQALQSANSSKAVRLQATTVIYLKKIQALQKQEFLVDRELQELKRQIEELRVRRKGGQQSHSTVSSRMTVTSTLMFSREGGRSKVQTLRKMIDRQNQKSKKIMGEVDKVRREIQTTKKLNEELEEELRQWTSRMESEQALMAELESLLAKKSQELQQKKMRDIHQKAHLLKEYDSILRKLDSELSQQGEKTENTPSNLYLTDPLVMGELKRQLPQPSPKSKKTAAQVSFLKEKVSAWEQQLQCLKAKMNVDTLSEAEVRLQEQHEVYFQRCGYLNERYGHLQELKRRNQELMQRKKELKERYVEAPASKNERLKEELRKKTDAVCSEQSNYKLQMQQIDGAFQELKGFVEEFRNRTSHILLADEKEVTKQNLYQFLQAILRVRTGNKE